MRFAPNRAKHAELCARECTLQIVCEGVDPLILRHDDHPQTRHFLWPCSENTSHTRALSGATCIESDDNTPESRVHNAAAIPASDVPADN